MKPPSQNDRILEVLQDGREHEMRDIHRIAGFCRLNSRISELRKRGLTITCRREGNNYFYRLVTQPEVISCPEPVYACVVDESAGQAEQLALTDSAASHLLRDMAGTPL